MTRKQHILDYAERELKLTGFDQSPLAEPTKAWLSAACDIANCDETVLLELSNLLARLSQCLPIAAITESDFEPETHSQGDSTTTIMRCTRYPYLYRMPDGRYYDDRALAFRRADSEETDRMYIYQTGNSSKQEVELPYLPAERVITLDQEYSDFDPPEPEPDYEVE